MTNADKIRNMSDKELNEFINYIGGTSDEYLCRYMGKEYSNSCANSDIDMCKVCVGKWLKSEAE